MITCGRTQLVAAIELLLETIPEADITFLTYERKNEHFPRSQPTHFYDDARRLNKIIPGRAYIFGDQDMHHIFLYHLDKPYHAEAGDMTLELLLHGIDEEAAKLFCSGEQRSLEHIHQQTGICQIIDGFTVDDFLFEPDGYSLNAINDQEYYTIHVTPQDTGSYVSFETNHGQFENYSAIIERVLNIFRPNSWDFVLFKSEWARIGIESEYFRKREVEQRLSCGFDVRFASFILPQKQVLSAKEIDIYEGEL
jgi:S-adenosylmethionine decarboxylase